MDEVAVDDGVMLAEEVGVAEGEIHKEHVS